MTEAFDERMVEDLARLARLRLGPEETLAFSHQLEEILGYFAQLAAVDTDGVPPTTHPLGPTAHLRDDLPAPSLAVETALLNAVEHQNHHFRVPNVIPHEPPA